METNQTNAEAGTSQSQSPAKANWDAIFESEDTVTNTTTATTEAEQTKDTTVESTEPVKAESVVEPAKTEEAAPSEKTDELAPLNVDGLELRAEDLKDVPKTYAENSYQKFAYDTIGLDVADNSIEAVKAAFEQNYVPRAQFEESNNLTTEKLLSTLRPEVATAFQLVQMGVPEEMAFNPTKDIDGFLALEDTVLVRSELESREGWTEDMVDIEMEELSLSPQKLLAKASIARANLNSAKNDILNERNQIVQRWNEQKQQESVRQVAEDRSRFKQALTNESTFLGLGLSADVKTALEAKYNSGYYDTIFTNEQAKLKAILQYEYGDKFSKVSLSKAKEAGKEEIIKQLSNVPIKTEAGSGGRTTTEQATSNWDFLKGG